MSRATEKCVRCGTRTRDAYEGKATCDTCRKEIELALASAREGQRACPHDASRLIKEIVQGVIIDRCPTCRGVWLDAGELERMNHEVAQEVWKAAALGRPLA